MKFRSLILCAAAFAMIAAPASAQSYRDPFTGFYVGANLGYMSARGKIEGVPVGALKPDNVIGGLQVGYNFPVNNFVIGAVADINFGSGEDAVRDGLYLKYKAESDWTGSIRGKLGYNINNRLMPYLTAGAMATRTTGSIECPAGALFGVCSFTGPFKASKTQTNWGWTIGGGVEVALLGNWTGSVEYLYADFGEPRTSLSTPFGAISGKTDQSLQEVKVSLNYHFR